MDQRDIGGLVFAGILVTLPVIVVAELIAGGLDFDRTEPTSRAKRNPMKKSSVYET